MVIIRPAVFLDRDGVLNELITRAGRLSSPRDASEVHIVDRAPDMIRVLTELSLPVICVTNQPDIARGKMTWEQLEEVHAALTRALPGLAAIRVCPHDDGDGCDCRKPKPGLLRTAAKDYGLALNASWMIGDRWVDVAAANDAGCRSILIESPHSWDPSSNGAIPIRTIPDFIVHSLPEAVELVAQAGGFASTRRSV